MSNKPSAADFKQANRILTVHSPLGDDVLLPESIRIEEGVSTLFEMRATVHAKRDRVKPEELIGRLVDISVAVPSDQKNADNLRRPFNGLVTAIHECPHVARGLRTYSITLRPQLWLLSQRSDCRIWMDKTSLDILATLLSEHDLPAADTSGVVSAPAVQHYSVQWNETDLAYLLRRFEEDGLFFWFEHSKGKHKLIVADRAISWREPSAAARGKKPVPITTGTIGSTQITQWMRSFSFVARARAGGDWNFETPNSVPRESERSLVQMPKAAKRELYDFPARAHDSNTLQRMLRLRMQAIESDHECVEGVSDVRFLEPGRRFLPVDPAGQDTYEDHVITGLVHQIVDGSYGLGNTANHYSNSFQAIPARIALTPHQTTDRPRLHGTQVAIVAGPKGEEIEVDSFGRVKLWFPWDRKARKDGSDTCWVRVAQSWAGSGFGSQIIPRIGMEVMVAFVDGDPDRPLVVGVVPNGSNAVPHALPASKTRSTLRTKTHKGNGFNELSFEDKTGSEEIYLHAQKDHRLHVLNDLNKCVDGSQVEKIGKIKTQEIGDRYEVTVGKSRLVMSSDGTIQISGTRITLDADQSIDLSANAISIQAKATLNTKAKITSMVASLINMAKG